MKEGEAQSGSGDHGGDQSGSGGHGRDEAGTGDHDEDRSGSTGDGAHQSQQSDPGEAMGMGDRERILGSRSFAQRFTVATGYVALVLLALTLLVGPANLLLRRPNPVSNYLTHDVGTWAAIASIVHVFYGLQVHGRLADWLDYFILDGRPLTNSFGLGNWTGLAATVMVVGLLATSSNFALRKLKARRWKRIQRLNYTLFVLVIAHAFFYGALLRMTSPFTLLLLLSAGAVFVWQAVGIVLWRRRFGSRLARQQP